VTSANSPEPRGAGASSPSSSTSTNHSAAHAGVLPSSPDASRRSHRMNVLRAIAFCSQNFDFDCPLARKRAMISRHSVGVRCTRWTMPRTRFQCRKPGFLCGERIG